MPTATVRRRALPLAIAGALLLTSLTLVSEAHASVLYACVKKDGSARIYARRHRCRRGETRLSWNSEGPAGSRGANGRNGRNGANGSNGANGVNGSNGAVAGYFASGISGQTLTGTETTIGQKLLPAGHYLLSAKVEIASEAKSAGIVGHKCQLNDERVLDTNYSNLPLGPVGGSLFFSVVTLPLLGVLNTTAPSTLSVSCENYSNPSAGTVTAIRWSISALQTSSNS